MFALDGPRSRLAHWEKTGASAVDPAYEPAKGPGGSLLVIRLPESATEMVVVMVTRVEPLMQRLRAPDVTAFALADPYSSLACRKLWVVSSDEPAF